MLTDPQTSGALLVSCRPDRAADIHATIAAAGYPAARIIGHVEAGPAACPMLLDLARNSHQAGDTTAFAVLILPFQEKDDHAPQPQVESGHTLSG